MNRFKPYLLLAAAIFLGAGACSSSDSNHVQTGLGDPNVVAKLRALALQAASSAGAPSPSEMYAVAVADHQAAETILSGAIINDHAPVYVIVIIGGPFTANKAPPGVSAPEGDVLTLTVDAATYEVTDAGIVDVEPDLSQVESARVDMSAA